MSEAKKLSNFIPINRDLFEHSLWVEERAFSRFEAWLYLLKEARFEDTKVLDKGQFVEVKRGQIYASYRFLANAFGWSTKKIRNFMKLLISDNMVKVETHKKTKQSLITITKYDTYNVIIKEDVDKGNVKETARKHEGNDEETKSNKENKDNKENNLLHIEWKKDFQIYLAQVTRAYKDLVSNVEYIKEREIFHPNLDIRLSLEKAFSDFWGTEAGWKNKKRSRSETLNWTSTFNNALSQKMNQVYKNKNDLFSSQSQVALPTKPQGRLLQ